MKCPAFSEPHEAGFAWTSIRRLRLAFLASKEDGGAPVSGSHPAIDIVTNTGVFNH
jgi:hypothetical protein